MIKKILSHLNIYEERRNKRTPPAAIPDYIEPIEIVPCDGGWPEYEEPLFEF